MKNRKSLIINHQSNIPIQYQKGYVEFYKLKFKITPDVLIPRPETELLVDEVLKQVKSLELRVMNESNNSALNTLNSELVILDLGTGSGNIAISLAKNLNLQSGIGKLNIIAADISEKALCVARQNAKFHNVSDRILFVQSNLLSALNSELLTSNSALIIVTNLPYILSARIPTLDPSVKDFEPHIALDGGKDGFDLYRKLFRQLKAKNILPDLLVAEIDHTQSHLAITEANKFFPAAHIEVKSDLARKPRILIINTL